MKTLRIVAIVIIGIGACLTGRALYLHAKAGVAEVLIRRAWEQSQSSGKPCPPWSWADTYPVARIRIPRLSYDEIVLEGATPRTLAFGPAHMRSAAAVGQPGNLVLAGHRTSWFRPLQYVARGDTIEVEWFAQNQLHTRNYSVESMNIVDPGDTRLLEPTRDDVLTLITCYPFGAGPRSPQRYVVRARPVQDAL